VAVEDVLRRARVLADLSRHDEVEALLREALALEPDNEDGLSLLARTQVQQHRFETAEETTGRLLAAHPASARGLTGMARIQWMLGRPRDGVPFARRAVELYPDSSACLVTLADLVGQVTPGSAEALALVRQALTVDPDYVMAFQVAADVELGAAGYAEAERWALQALRVAPENADAMLTLGLARAGLGRFEESRAEVVAALRGNTGPNKIDQAIEYVECRAIPDHLAELYRMMLAARGLPDVSEPGSAGDEPALLAAQGKLAYRMYSLHATKAGRRKAGVLADAVLAADPTDPDARYIRSRTLSDAERYDEALPLAEELHREGYPHADDALLMAYSGLGRHEEALAAIRRARQLRPELPLYLRAEAHCLRYLERYDEAYAAARQAAELSPAGPGIQLSLGLAAKAAGDLDVAERAIRLAMEHDPDEGEPIAELALLFAETDRWPEAEELMARLHPGLPDVRQLLRPCTPLAAACMRQALPALGEIDDDDPDPQLLADAAYWLDKMVDMYAVAAHGYSEGTAAFAELLGTTAGALHELTVPPDSSYAALVRRFDGLMAEWRSP
jgi:tetratricopeptide (TPR) repeat protein